MPKTSTTLDTSKLDSILKRLDANVANAVAKAAFAIEGRAKVKAPVDTGALRASIYTSLKAGGGDAARVEARSRRPEAIITPLPVPRDDHTAYVGPSVEYGADVELGTTRRGATPYLLPAVRETEKEFYKLIGEAVTDG